jgi:hypothetical protein
MVDDMGMPDLFRDFKCDKYEYDEGIPPERELPWYPSEGEDGSTYALGGSSQPVPYTEPF